jgi:PAS domain S-box-containing protein
MHYTLSELIDVDEVQELADRLYEVTGMSNAVLDLDGNILTCSGWQSACTEFHRKNPETEKMCLESDSTIANKILSGDKYAIYICKLGLVNAAIKIVIEGKHVGNIFAGQFFFEPPDMSLFTAQAKKFGFDEKDYLKAISNIPVFSEEKVKKYLDFLAQLAGMISSLGLNRIHLIESEKSSKESERNLRNSEEKYRNIVEINPYVIFQLDIDGKISFISNRIHSILGYDSDELVGTFMSDLIYKDDIKKYNKIFERRTGNRSTSRLELRFNGKNDTDSAGSIWIGINATGVYRDGYIGSGNRASRGDSKGEIVGIHGTISDLTEIKKADKAVRTLFDSTVGSVGMDFFDNAVKNLCEWLETDYAIIGQLTGGKVIEVLSMQIDGKHIHDYSYNLKGTPCNEATENGFCFYPENICTLFPEDKDLVNLKAEGYIGTPIINKNNEPVGILCAISRTKLKNAPRVKEVIEIIAAKASAEIERRKSEEALKAAFDIINMSHAVVFLWKNEKGWPIEFVTENVKEVFDYSSEEFKSGSVQYTDIIHPDDLERVGKEVITNSEDDCIERFIHEPYRIISKSGEVVWLDDRTYIKRDENGRITHYQGIILDITERRKTEEKLQEKQHFNDLLLNSFPHHAMLINKKRVILAANKIALEAGAKIGGYCWKEFLKGEYLTDEMKAIAETNPHDKRIKCKFCLMDKAMDGRMRTENDDSVCVFDKIYDTYWVPINDEIYLHYAVDVTNRNELEEERLKASKLESVGILAGGIAHDFNNILAAILGNISLTRISLDDKDEILELLGEAENAGMRAKELTQQLLSFSKGGAPVKTINEISGIIEDTVKFSLRGSNVQCNLSLDSDLKPAEFDKGQISQAINNLVINAKQAMFSGGTLSISAENIFLAREEKNELAEGNYIRIIVADEGCGISKEHLSKIFDPYFTTKLKGSGLGLATTYSIIHRHGGHISVVSEIGEGTTFTIYLPASPKSVERQDLSKSKTGTISGKILVMDDDKLMRNLIAKMLESFEMEVALADDGAEAIEKYKTAMDKDTPFTAVIMDLTVPGGMGGEIAIKQLLKIDPQVKAVVSSGYSNDHVLSNFEKYGFKGVISKPFMLDDLKETLNEVINMNSTGSINEIPLT